MVTRQPVLAAAIAAGLAVPSPSLGYAFSAIVTLVAPPVEQGPIDGGRKGFIAITGGTVSRPMRNGKVLSGGGDWQEILPGGLARVEARGIRQRDRVVIDFSVVR